MLRKLRFAESACNVGALTSCMLMLLAASGPKANGAVLFTLLAGMVLLVFSASRFRKQINAILLEEHEKLPIKSTKAKVVKRRVGYRYRGGGGRSGTVRSGPPMYYMTFETELGDRMELYVSRDVYFANPEDKTGILRYKGDEFISLK